MKKINKIVVSLGIFFVISIIIELAIFNYGGTYNYFNGADTTTTTYSMDTLQHNLVASEDTFKSELHGSIVAENLNKYIKEINLVVKTNQDLTQMQVFTTDKDNVIFTEENSFFVTLENNSALIPIGSFITDIRFDLSNPQGLEFSEVDMQITPQSININFMRIIFTTILLGLFLLFVVKSGVFSGAKKGVFALFLSIATIRMVFYAGLTSFARTTDSYGYIAVNSLDFLKATLHETRVPIYPTLIDIAQMIFTEQFYLSAIVSFQIAISFIALLYFYKALCYILKNKYFIYAITAMYGLSPAIIGWDKVILTESLALSGSVFFIYLMLKYLNTPSAKTIALSSILILVLILFRPTFLILLPMFIVFLIAKFILDSSKEEKTIIKKCLFMPVLVGVVVLGYALLFLSQFSVFSLSNTLLSQNIVTIVQKDYYRAIEDQELIRKIDETIQQNGGEMLPATGVISNHIPKEELQDFVSTTLSKNLPKKIEDTMMLSLHLMDLHFPGNSYYSFNTNQKDVFIKDHVGQYYEVESKWGKAVDLGLRGAFNIISFAHVYLIILCGIIAIFYTMIRHKKILWVECGLIGIILLTVASALIGTFAEYARTAICVLPYCYMAIARGIHLIIKNNKHEVSL